MKQHNISINGNIYFRLSSMPCLKRIETNQALMSFLLHSCSSSMPCLKRIETPRYICLESQFWGLFKQYALFKKDWNYPIDRPITTETKSLSSMPCLKRIETCKFIGFLSIMNQFKQYALFKKDWNLISSVRNDVTKIIV